MPLSAQAKLLRVVQQREFERVGGSKVLTTDARIVSATHRDLPREVAAGRFREDLFYRLNVVRIAIPPLRERPDDIAPLVDAILRRLERKYGWAALALAPESWDLVRRADWPGNVRQLENALARAAIAARGRALLPEHFAAEETIAAVVESEHEQPLPAPRPAGGGRAPGRPRRPGRVRRQPHQGRRPTGDQPAGKLFDKLREFDLGT